METGQLLQTFKGHKDSINSVAISPDSKSIVSGSGDKTVKRWSFETGLLLQSFKGHEDSVNTVAFSPEGNSIISGSWDKTVKRWSLETGLLLQTFKGHTGSVASAAISPDGKSIVSGSEDKAVKRWSLETGQLLQTFNGHKDFVSSIAISSDGKSIVSGSEDKTVKRWSLETGQLLQTFRGHEYSVYSVAVSPDGKSIISGSGDKTVKRWSLETGQLLQTFKGHTDSVTSVAISLNGKSIVSGSLDKTVKRWSLETGQLLQTFNGHKDYISSVAISPDGKSIVSGSWDKTVKHWSLETGQLLQTFVGHQYPVGSIAISLDGKSIISAGVTVKRWSLETGQLLQTFKGHTDSITSVAISPDGKSIISGSWDKTVKRWSLETGLLLQTFNGYKYPVTSIAFSPDGKNIINGGADGIKYWQIDTRHPLNTFWAGNNGTWFRLDYNDKNPELSYLTVADNGTVLLRKDQDNYWQSVLPKAASKDKDKLSVSIEPVSLTATQDKHFYKIRVYNQGNKPAYWIKLLSQYHPLEHQIGLFISPYTEAGLNQQNQAWIPESIQVLAPKQSAVLYANIFMDIPYQQAEFFVPKPAGYTVPIHLITANGTTISTKLNVKIKLSKPEFIDQENSYNAEKNTLQLNLQNAGEGDLRDINFKLNWKNASNEQIEASLLTIPRIKPQSKQPLSFALPKDISDEQIASIHLLAETNRYPRYRWRGKPEISIHNAWLMWLVAAVSLLLLGTTAFIYRRNRILRHPLVLELSASPTHIFELPPEQIGDAKRRLSRAKSLDLVLDKSQISDDTFTQSIEALANISDQQTAAYLAERLSATLTTADNKATKKGVVFELQLSDSFSLNLSKIRLYLAHPSSAVQDVFTELKSLANAKGYICLIIGKNSAFQRTLYKTTTEPTNKWVAPRGAELTRLLLSPDAEAVLATVLASQIALKHISPYRIGGGVEDKSLFFGRTEIINQIINRDPANYLVLGGRQMGKSSLLKALKRHYVDIASIDCYYQSLASEVLLPRLASQLKLPKCEQPDDFAQHLSAYLQTTEQHLVFLIDEADRFVQSEIDNDYQVLNVLRRFSEEGRCSFILAGFWQLYRHAVLDYQSPLRNFAEIVSVGALEKEACYQLTTVPMQSMNLSYANEAIIEHLLEKCGQRANLIVIACMYIINHLPSHQRVIEAGDVHNALYSDDINKAIAGWVISDEEQARFYDKLVVYSSIDQEDFSSGELIQSLQKKGVKVDMSEFDASLARLELAYIIGKDQQGRYRYRVPLLVEMIKNDSPQIRLDALLEV